MSEAENIEDNELISLSEAAKLVGKSMATIRAIFYRNTVERHYKNNYGKKVPVIKRSELLQIYPEKTYIEGADSKENIHEENTTWVEEKLRFYEEHYHIVIKQLEVKDTQIRFLQNEVLNARGVDLSLKEMQSIINMVKAQNMAKDEYISSLQRQFEISQNRLKVLEEVSLKYAINPGFISQEPHPNSNQSKTDCLPNQESGLVSNGVLGELHLGYKITKNDPMSSTDEPHIKFSKV